jgi:mono/diheme cytochrome c family protein
LLHRSNIALRAFVLSAFAFALTSCLCSKPKSGSNDPNAALVAKGKTVYMTTCVACHNSDPKKEGSIGPDVWGSSKELLEAKVLRRGYPEGHTPKRNSVAMPSFPHLEKDIEALHKFLNASASNSN